MRQLCDPSGSGTITRNTTSRVSTLAGADGGSANKVEKYNRHEFPVENGEVTGFNSRRMVCPMPGLVFSVQTESCMKRLFLTAAVLALATASAEARPHLFGRRSQGCTPAAQGACNSEATPAKPQGSSTGQTMGFTSPQVAPPAVQNQAVSGPRFPLLSRVFGGGICANGQCGGR